MRWHSIFYLGSVLALVNGEVEDGNKIEGPKKSVDGRGRRVVGPRVSGGVRGPVRRARPPLHLPPYAVQMEPLVQYSQRDPLYHQKLNNTTAEPPARLDHDPQPSENLADLAYPQQRYDTNPYYYTDQEPIIEIIIKESNESLPAPPPPPPTPPPTKEPVHVFYVKYKKNPNPETGEEEVVYDPPVAAVTPPSSEVIEEKHSTEDPYHQTTLPPPPPSPPTTLRTVIRPDSEIYHGSGLRVTFGGPEERHESGELKEQSAPEPRIVLPQDPADPPTPSHHFKRQQPYNPQNVQYRQHQHSQQAEESAPAFRPQHTNTVFQKTSQQAQKTLPLSPQLAPQHGFPLHQHYQRPQAQQFQRTSSSDPSGVPLSSPGSPFIASDQQHQKIPIPTPAQIQQYQKQKQLLHQQNLQRQQALQQQQSEHQPPVAHFEQSAQPTRQVGPAQPSSPQTNFAQYRSKQPIHVAPLTQQYHRAPLVAQSPPQQPKEHVSHQSNQPQHLYKPYSQAIPPRSNTDYRNQNQQHQFAPNRPLQPQYQQTQVHNNFGGNHSTDVKTTDLRPNSGGAEIVKAISLEEHEINPTGKGSGNTPFYRQPQTFQNNRPQPYVQNPYLEQEPRYQSIYSSTQQSVRQPVYNPTQQTVRQPLYTTTQQPPRQPIYSTPQEPVRQSLYSTVQPGPRKPFYSTTSQPQRQDHYNARHPVYTSTTTTTSRSPPNKVLSQDPSSSERPADYEGFGAKKENENSSPEDEKKSKANLAALPDEVPEDLREQLLSSGILGNADIQILDYDKVGDIPIESLPPEALENFYGAGSDPVPAVVEPDSGVKKPVEMKVVRYDPNTAEGQGVADSYVREDSTRLDPVVLNDSRYNRYLPLKVSGIQFPVPDVPQLKGRIVNSVVVLAPVDYDFIKQSEEGEEREGRAVQVQGVRFIAGDTLKDLVKSPTSINYRRWLDKERATPTDRQSVVLLVTREKEGNGEEEKSEIFMYDIGSEKVSKLRGELSAAFVQVAESNSESKDLEGLSVEEPAFPGKEEGFGDRAGSDDTDTDADASASASQLHPAFLYPPQDLPLPYPVLISSGYSKMSANAPFSP